MGITQIISRDEVGISDAIESIISTDLEDLRSIVGVHHKTDSMLCRALDSIKTFEVDLQDM